MKCVLLRLLLCPNTQWHTPTSLRYNTSSWGYTIRLSSESAVAPFDRTLTRGGSASVLHTSWYRSQECVDQVNSLCRPLTAAESISFQTQPSSPPRTSAESHLNSRSQVLGLAGRFERWNRSGSRLAHGYWTLRIVLAPRNDKCEAAQGRCPTLDGSHELFVPLFQASLRRRSVSRAGFEFVTRASPPHSHARSGWSGKRRIERFLPSTKHRLSTNAPSSSDSYLRRRPAVLDACEYAFLGRIDSNLNQTQRG